MKLILSTPRGNYYQIDPATGNITQEGQSFSNQWKMLGIKHVSKNLFIPLAKLTPEFLKTLPLRYKNGNPQWTVRDLDHGTAREWGNTKYHGIAHLYYSEK